MKKILLSVSVIAVVAAVVIGVTTAFFSDTETSTGNTFTAGSLDLLVDSNCSYNGQPSTECGVWGLGTNGENLINQKFFNFLDVKPGDTGENTISLFVDNNPAWACAEVALTMDDDITCTEPELGDDTTCAEPDVTTNDLWDGDMISNMTLMWWPDFDCTNDLDESEYGKRFFMSQETIAQIFGNGNHNLYLTLADEDTNFFGELDNAGKPLPLAGDKKYCVGLAWCMGTMTTVLNNNGVYDIKCDGASVNNAPQSDKLMADLKFSVMQHRNNLTYDCYDSITGPKPK
jgi:predicted ribosomally synthesized peptide with SipW-like signal peptide